MKAKEGQIKLHSEEHLSLCSYPIQTAIISRNVPWSRMQYAWRHNKYMQNCDRITQEEDKLENGNR